MGGTLYIISTPIGNMKDISLRAVEVLKTVDIVACEDTRHSGKLLKHLGLKKTLVSYHEHNEAQRRPSLIKTLRSGKSVALISDAGTPCISDPGFGLVDEVRKFDLSVTVIPGPTAFVSALVLSGLPSDAIFFGGFLPSKTGARKKILRELAELKATLIFYESPRRLAASLADCATELGSRKAALVREITKLHEQTLSGNLRELADKVSADPPKGEIVLLIDRQKPDDEIGDDPEMALIELLEKFTKEGLDRKTALKKAAKICGYSKPEAYRIVENHKNS